MAKDAVTPQTTGGGNVSIWFVVVVILYSCLSPLCVEALNSSKGVARTGQAYQ